MPASLKVRRLETKHVLRHAARGLVPDRIIDKPKIGFFNSAVDDWFRAQTRGAISDYLLGPNPRYAEMIDRSEVERLVKSHADRSDSGNGYALLSILMLEVWLAEYLPRSLAAAAPGARESPPEDALVRGHHPGSRRAGEPAAARRQPGGADGAAAALADRRQRLRGRHARARAGARARARVDPTSSPCQGAAAAERGAPIVRALHAASRSFAPTRPTSSSTSTPTSRSSPTTSRGCSTASTPTRRSGSRAAAPSSSRTATGASATSPARPSGARRAPSAGPACRRSCPSRSGSPGTASTSSRPTRAAGDAGLRGSSVQAPPPRGRARRAPGGRGGTRATPRTTSATAPGISSCARSSTRARSPPRSG